MTHLLVGFDSAWTAAKSGAIVGVLRHDDGTCEELGRPRRVDYREAESQIDTWQADRNPSATVVLLDQPTIVTNPSGQRPVERIASSPVSRRRGGMQPANTKKASMFGPAAPVWRFLEHFGGAPDPSEPLAGTRVFETYPTLAIIALGWLPPDSRPSGRLPKYNPAARKPSFAADWRFVCAKVSSEMSARGLVNLTRWLEEAACMDKPGKGEQDGVDACICLLAALHLAEGRKSLMVGDVQTGYIVVPYGESLEKELVDRCREMAWNPSEWVRTVRHTLGNESKTKLYMVIERFRDGDPIPVYRRFRDRGRLAPQGLRYVSSWVTEDLTTCYQVMECADRALLDAWIAAWSDLVEFEVVPVVTSEEAATHASERL